MDIIESFNSEDTEHNLSNIQSFDFLFPPHLYLNSTSFLKEEIRTNYTFSTLFSSYNISISSYMLTPHKLPRLEYPNLGASSLQFYQIFNIISPNIISPALYNYGSSKELDKVIYQYALKEEEYLIPEVGFFDKNEYPYIDNPLDHLEPVITHYQQHPKTKESLYFLTLQKMEEILSYLKMELDSQTNYFSDLISSYIQVFSLPTKLDLKEAFLIFEKRKFQIHIYNIIETASSILSFFNEEYSYATSKINNIILTNNEIEDLYPKLCNITHQDLKKIIIEKDKSEVNKKIINLCFINSLSYRAHSYYKKELSYSQVYLPIREMVISKNSEPRKSLPLAVKENKVMLYKELKIFKNRMALPSKKAYHFPTYKIEKKKEEKIEIRKIVTKEKYIYNKDTFFSLVELKKKIYSLAIKLMKGLILVILNILFLRLILEKAISILYTLLTYPLFFLRG